MHTKPSTIRPNPGALTTAIVIAFVITLLLGSAAAASPREDRSQRRASPYMSSTGAIRDCVKVDLVGCRSWGTVSSGRAVTMHCWVDGSRVTEAYSSPRWFFVTIPSLGNRKGYVHSSRVGSQASVPACSSQRGIAASTWASERVGVYDMSDAEWTAVDPSHTYSRAWSGGCAGFVYLSFKHGAKVTPSTAGDAAARYEWYRSRGRVSTTGTPDVGSMIFWPNVSAWGHVATYVGNGMVATTVGYPGERKKNARVAMSSFGTPAGWVLPSKI